MICNFLPDVDMTLKEHDIELSLITLHWFLTLFASVVHMKILLRIWDLFFFDGSIVLFQVTLGMLKIKGMFNCSIFIMVSYCMPYLKSQAEDVGSNIIILQTVYMSWDGWVTKVTSFDLGAWSSGLSMSRIFINTAASELHKACNQLPVWMVLWVLSLERHDSVHLPCI